METTLSVQQLPNKFTNTRINWPLGLGLKIETISPFQGKYRPHVGQPCQSCTPKSMENFFYKRYTQMGFRNALHITEQDSRFRGWLVRRLCCFIFIWERPVDKDLSSDLLEKIYKHPNVQVAIIQELAKDKEHTDLTDTRAEIPRILGQIHRPLSPLLIRVTRWLLAKMLTSLFLNVHFHCGQVATVREAAAACPGTPMVFLSTHPSWLDSLLLPFLLFSQNLKVPRVVWDRRDCPRLLRVFLQRLGAVFVPTDGGAWSKAVLSAYTGTLLAEGHSLLIFLEDPSSRYTHTLSSSGCEWIQEVVGTLRSGLVSDILIVPVGISYDCCLEDLVTGREVTASSGVWRSFLSVLCPWFSTFGCTRVDFAQPFSLQEYVTSYLWRRLEPPPSLKETLLPNVFGYKIKLYDEVDMETEPHKDDSQEQSLVDGFILHSLSAAVSCTAIMSSHITAGLLLYRYRAGVSLCRLLADFSLLTEDILHHGFDVGFSGQRWDLVRHSLQILRRSVSLFSAVSGDLFVLSRGSQESILELEYKSAALLHIFIYEAIGACGLHALLFQIPALGQSEILFAQDEILDKVLSLCYLLPRTLLLQTPCQSPYIMCQDILDKLIQCGLLATYDDPTASQACDTGRRYFTDKLTWRAVDDMTDSDSDYAEEEVKRYYKLGRSGPNANFFVFLCHLLGPVLRTYERAAQCLAEQGERRKGMNNGELGKTTLSYKHHFQLWDTETGHVKRLHAYLQHRAEHDGSFECAEYSLTACAFRTFLDLGVFVRTQQSPGSEYCLSETFLLKENCQKLVSFIQQFVYNF
ncbi:glycerol-3-phosphate acyltransferase 2, mitochondrial [Spea bombifrons]|uniref:glycerol-3-phosphate acyltransferase 2, mitochondrial n=1 Tax=Spea bombifrons TaxID=233779 RepID=UPI00234BD34B|nr:glycerol-3-phosphate acyltransferase 2, mitochondrial [Spea bombifrons]